MSRLYVNQDWETDAAPGAISGTAVARSTTNAIAGTDLRIKITAAGPVGLWQAAIDPDLVPGSRRGLRFQMSLNCKSVITPVTEAIMVMRWNDVHLQLDTADKLKLIGNDLSSSTGATALGTSARQVDVEIRHETDTGLWARAWLDGALECDLRDPAGSAETLYTFVEGGTSSGKVSAVEFIWGDMKMWFAQDAQ